MNTAIRAKALLFDPALEWQRIEQEGADPAFILSHYVAILALIPALFSFVGASVIGVADSGGATQHASIFNGLFGAIFGYVMSCASVLLLTLIVDLVAPLFSGERSFDNAFRLAVYSFTPVWLAGIFLILPGLHFLALTACYGAYILWLGVPRMMKAPTRRALNFAAVIAICAFVVNYATAVAQQLVFGTPGL